MLTVDCLLLTVDCWLSPPLYYSRFTIQYFTFRLSTVYCLLFTHERFVAHPQIPRIARHSCHASHVDTGCRQDSATANAAGESLVECAVICVRTRSYDLPDALSRWPYF